MIKQDKKLPKKPVKERRLFLSKDLKQRCWKLLTASWPYLLIGLIVFVFFYPVWLKGFVPIPADIIAGMYYPWLDYKWGFEVGVPVRNPLLSDAVSQVWIVRNWAIEHLRNGKVAIWNPYALNGYPLSPWFHTALFSPSNIFYFLTDKLSAMSLIVITQFGAALVFMYVFLNDLLKNRIASLFGAMSFSFSAFLIGWLSWVSIGWTVVFLPLILFFSKKLVKNWFQPKYFLGLFFSILASLLGGFPQMFLYVSLVYLIYIIRFFWDDSKIFNKKFYFLVATFLLSILAASFAVLPSFEILQYSIRQEEGFLSSVNFGLMPLYKIVILLFAPNLFGNPASGNYWGEGYNFQEQLVWFGSSALVLAIFALFNCICRKDKKYYLQSDLKIFLFIFFLGIALSVKYPFGYLVYKLKIPFLSTISASRALFLSVFSGSVLASIGLKNILEEKISYSSARKTAMIWLSIVLGISGGLFLSILVFRLNGGWEYRHFVQDFLQNIRVATRNLVIPFVSSFAAICFLFSVYKFQTNKRFLFLRKVGGIVLVMVLLLEGFYFGWRYTPFVKRNLYFPETPVIRFLQDKYQKEKTFFRIEREKGELLPPNMWMAYRFYSTAGYDPVYPLSYGEFLRKKGLRGGYSRYIEWERDNELFDYLGVRYFLVLKRTPQGRADPAGDLPYWLDKNKWGTAFEDGAVAVLENKEFSPPYLLVDRDNNLIPDSKLTLTKKKDDLWEFAVETPQRATLVLKENYFPGWQVEVDGVKKQLISTDGVSKRVEVDRGIHKVRFYYQNNLLKTGFLISGIALVVVVLVSFKMRQ